MDSESIVDLAQLGAEPSSWRAAPVLAKSRPARESGAGKGLAGFAALVIFMAGLTSAVAFKSNIRPAALPADATRPAPVVVARAPAAALAMHYGRPLARAASGGPSPRPFYGKSGVILAAGADDPLAAAQDEEAALVPFAGHADCPYCNVKALESRPGRETPYLPNPGHKWTRWGVVHEAGMCGGEYVYEIINESNVTQSGPLQLNGSETWDINVPAKGVSWIKSKRLLASPGSDIIVGNRG